MTLNFATVVGRLVTRSKTTSKGGTEYTTGLLECEEPWGADAKVYCLPFVAFKRTHETIQAIPTGSLVLLSGPLNAREWSSRDGATTGWGMSWTVQRVKVLVVEPQGEPEPPSVADPESPDFVPDNVPF